MEKTEMFIMLLIPNRIKSITELRNWLKKREPKMGKGYALGLRHESKLRKIKEFGIGFEDLKIGK